MCSGRAKSNQLGLFPPNLVRVSVNEKHDIFSYVWTVALGMQCQSITPLVWSTLERLEYPRNFADPLTYPVHWFMVDTCKANDITINLS